MLQASYDDWRTQYPPHWDDKEPECEECGEIEEDCGCIKFKPVRRDPMDEE